MRSLDVNLLTGLLKQNRVKPRLVRELRPRFEIITDWSSIDILAIFTRSRNEGVLIHEKDKLYTIPFELAQGIKDKVTGREKPITCDFCCTWQKGSNAGIITFFDKEDAGHTFSFLCCADLACSLHVRGFTPAATLSRTQLHEDMTTEQRIARLRSNTEKILGLISLT